MRLSCQIPFTVFLIAAGLGSLSKAGTLYQTGFEPPTFTVGTLSGQDSWGVSGSSALTVVESAVVKSGAQAVGITPSFSGLDGALRGASYNIATNSQKLLTFSIDAFYTATGSPSFWTAIDTQYGGAQPNIDLNIDTSGQISIFATGISHSTGVFITRGTWNHYDLAVNFFNDTVSAFYNGNPVLSGASFANTTGTTLGLVAF